MLSTKPDTSVPIIITTTDFSTNAPEFKKGVVDPSLLYDTTWRSRAPDSPLSAASSHGSDEYFDDCLALSPGGSVRSTSPPQADHEYLFQSYGPITDGLSSIALNSPTLSLDYGDPFDSSPQSIRSQSDISALLDFNAQAPSSGLDTIDYSHWPLPNLSYAEDTSSYYPPGLGLDDNPPSIFTEDIVNEWVNYPSAIPDRLPIGELQAEDSIDRFNNYLPEHFPSSSPEWQELAEESRISPRESHREARRHSPYSRSRSNSRVEQNVEALDHSSPFNSLRARSATIPSDGHLSGRLLTIPTTDNRSYADGLHPPPVSTQTSSPEPSPPLYSPTTSTRNSSPYHIHEPEWGVDNFATQSQSSSIDLSHTPNSSPGNAVASSSTTPDTKFRPEVGSAAMVQACHERRKPENKEGAFHCPEPGCMANFTAKHNLMNHTNSHKGIRNFECLLCERKFGTRHVLTRHERTCKGPKKYGQLTPL